MAIEKKTTHKTEAKARLVQQFRGKTNLESLSDSYVEEIQNLEAVCFDLLKNRADPRDLISGTSTSVGQGFLESTSSNFTPGAFADAFLEDANGRLYRIRSNTTIRISIVESATPAAGKFVVATTVGANLNNLGRLVGETRQGKKDGDYRASIRNRIIGNSSTSTLNELLTLIKNTSNYTGTGMIDVIENYPASLTFFGSGMKWADSDSALKAFSLLRSAKGAGVRLQFIYGIGTTSDPIFTFATGVGGGFDNVAHTESSAGKLAGIFVG